MTAGRTEPSALERAWAVLSPPTGTHLASYPLDFVDGCACRVALDSTGTRHLLVPVSEEVVATDARPAVLGLTVRKLSFAGATETFVDVSCAEIDLFAEFDDVVADVLEQVTRSDRPGATTVQTVARWRRLFRNKLVHGLSRQAELGLFAELSILAHLIEADGAFPVDAWRGPLREPHDFEAHRHCLEVKAIGAESQAVTIHGLDQLAAHDDKPLHLVIVTVLEDAEGSTVGDLVDQLEAAVNSRSELRARLAAAGWGHSDDPTEETFSIAEVLHVRVGQDTPRLVPESLRSGTPPSGVTNLRYDVDLAALLPLTDVASLAVIAHEVVS